MGKPACSEDEFIALWRRYESPTGVASHLGVAPRNVSDRRRRIESKRGISLPSKYGDGTGHIGFTEARGIRLNMEVEGTVIVFSDAHYGPGPSSKAHQALVRLTKELQPALLIGNGDLLDGASISRHEPIGWETKPSVKQEIEITQERLHEIVMACPGARRVRTIGNHDLRFDRYLASNAPEMRGIEGMCLDDHLPDWQSTWSLMLNKTCMVKHRYHNGIHATYNNALKSGLSMVTGHLHRLCITPFGDYRGRRWGVDTGTLADLGPEVSQFHYAEDDPRPWCSGFGVLTFREGRLLPPELCEVIEGVAYFRGRAV